MALPGKRNLRKAIKECGGVVSDVADHFDKTRQTIYNWLDHYQMRGYLDDCRQDMRAVARDVIYQRLIEGDTDIAKFVLSRLGKDVWSERREHTGPGGADLSLDISERAIDFMRQQGMDQEKVLAHLSRMIEEYAEQNGESGSR